MLTTQDGGTLANFGRGLADHLLQRATEGIGKA